MTGSWVVGCVVQLRPIPHPCINNWPDRDISMIYGGAAMLRGKTIYALSSLSTASHEMYG